MSNLEQKLIELGYELTETLHRRNKPYENIYKKSLNNTCHIEVHYIFSNKDWFKDWFIYMHMDHTLVCEYEIKRINETFAEMEKDWEILKGVID